MFDAFGRIQVHFSWARISWVKNAFHRRVFRFVRDPRYRILYGGPWESAENLAWELDARLRKADFCAPWYTYRSERHIRHARVLAKFWEEISPRWEWPDYVGNALFAITSCIVAFWFSLRIEGSVLLALFVAYCLIRSCIWWKGHQKYLRQLRWRLECQIDPLWQLTRMDRR